MTHRIYQVDAFADQPFGGNPAAVVPIESEWPDDGWLQAVAREMNLSETAFVRLRPDGEPLGLRWFTPGAEVDLCGHATLASAWVLWNELGLDGHRFRFQTRSGLLEAARTSDGWIELDFPATPATTVEPDPVLLAALGLSRVAESRRSRFDALLVVAEAETVRSVAPDFRRLADIDVRGVIVTAEDDGEADFVSRFFAPRVGVDEDPVTGSAHCALAPYWCDRLGRPELVGYQASVRGGTVRVAWSGGDRVTLRGRAVGVLRGELVT